MPVGRWLLASAAVLLVPTAARAQWQNGDLALRTNGDLFQAGDRLKVEVLALGPILGPFAAEVRYRFVEDVEVVDGERLRRARRQEKVVTRPVTAMVERMDPYRRLVLDDTFHVGEGRAGPCLRVEARLFSSSDAPRPFTTLASCVCVGGSREVSPECAPYLRGLKQALSEDGLVFDGVFSPDGDYSLLLLSEDRVEAHVARGTATVSSGDLQVFSPLLRRAAGRALDVLVHDHRREQSSTARRLPLPAASP